MSGRKSLLQQLSTDEKGEDRFRFLAEQIEAKKLTIEQAAKILNRHPKTIRRNIERLGQKDADRITAAPVGKWEQMPEAKTWAAWLKLQTKEKAATYTENVVRKLWETVWGHKPLSALSETDFMQARSAIETEKGIHFNKVMALRYLVRYGFGKPEYLTKFLRTKALKPPPRMPQELTIRELFPKIIPRVKDQLEAMEKDGTLTPDIRETSELVIDIKRTTGIRTGERGEERELWGTRIGQGRSAILLDQEGRFLNWQVLGKKSESWSIKRETFAPQVRERLESYIRARGLKQGDWLLHHERDTIARAVKKACKQAGITELELHDFRKMYATGFIFAGVPLEIAVDLNVGWRDINTMKKHYLTIKSLNAEAEYHKLAAFLGLNGQEGSA